MMMYLLAFVFLGFQCCFVLVVRTWIQAWIEFMKHRAMFILHEDAMRDHDVLALKHYITQSNHAGIYTFSERDLINVLQEQPYPDDMFSLAKQVHSLKNRYMNITAVCICMALINLYWFIKLDFGSKIPYIIDDLTKNAILYGIIVFYLWVGYIGYKKIFLRGIRIYNDEIKNFDTYVYVHLEHDTLNDKSRRAKHIYRALIWKRYGFYSVCIALLLILIFHIYTIIVQAIF